MVGPGARKPSVGEGIESRRPLFCSGITTLHSLFIYFFLSFIFTFASILVCVNNNNNNNYITHSLYYLWLPKTNLWVMRFIHVGCLVTSTKVVITQRQDSIRPCRAHAVLSLRYNYYLMEVMQTVYIVV